MDVFGYFETARLFVTGDFLKIHGYDSIYYHMIMTEMTKELRQLIGKKTYRTKFNLFINTSIKQQERSKYTTDLGYKHFDYDTFTKGDLRVVASTTYMLDSELRESSIDYNTNRQRPNFSSSSLIQSGNMTNGSIIRGEEPDDKRIRIDLLDKSYRSDGKPTMYLCMNSISPY
jgi:hypothetical protein